MKWSLSSLLFLLGIAIASSAHSATAPVQPAPQEVLKTLRPGHPRLFVLDEDIARMKKQIAEDATARKYYQEIKARGEKTLDERPVEFIIVGPRLLSQSRRCLSRVVNLALLYRLDGDKRYAERAKKELFAAADFPNWNPSHFLDTAELSNAFGIGYDWLYDSLTPAERERIRTALVEKGLKPGIKIYQQGGWWVKSGYNWNQVCNGGMTVGALAIADEETSLAAYIVSSAVRSIPRAMASYAPEGGWAEGPGYWSYATTYNVYFLAAIEKALGTTFGLTKMDGFDDAGTFRMYFVGPTGRSFNYADAHDSVGGAAAMFWMARHFDRPVYAAHERGIVDDDEASPWHLIWYDPRGEGPKASGLPLDKHFRGVDVVFLRSDWEDPKALWVGFKGGDNKANHSNLDLGVFVLDALGHRWAVDLGGDDYNLPAYFGKNRWTYFRLKNEGHNTLTINGENQDPRAEAPIIAFVSKADRSAAVADLTAAYKMATRVWRGIAMLDRQQVLVQDEIEAKEPVEVVWGMMTPAKLDLKGREAMLSIGNERLAMRIVSPEGAQFDTMPAAGPKPQNQNRGISKIVVRLPEKVTNTTISVVMTPVQEGVKVRDDARRFAPLQVWVDSAKEKR